MHFVETVRTGLQSLQDRIGERRIIVGVSGGADSIALLRAFQTLEIPCSVAHLNHQLRGAESDADEEFVRRVAAELACPFYSKRVDVRALAEQTGRSIEMAARQARHGFFAQFEHSVIALAHQADDQVETFLLKLARGAGPEGLSGMPPYQEIGDLKLIRPMLGAARPEIIQWLEENRFKWREDASNTDETFLRNRVRHTVLPMLQNELNPNIRETILRTMDILRAENKMVDEASSFVVHGTKLEASSTLEQPLAIRRRMIRKWLFQQGAETASFETVEKILELMARAEGTSVYELNDRQRVVVEYGTPRFEDDRFQPLETSWTLTQEPGTGWIRDESRIGDTSACASISAEKPGCRPLEVRTVRPGDRMAPLGMEGSRKLQDILTDLKIPKMQRGALPVVVCGEEIVWLPGYRLAREWEVHGSDGKSLHLSVEQKRTE
ncbi:tRNA lysidine(34) synthetase TilS [Pontiella sp.]|uniref:tRNA lysidine(34) synthetase TilS n=1 Tax=Pontiella sp. TaxID=2837462 RepID=UPI003561CD41